MAVVNGLIWTICGLIALVDFNFVLFLVSTSCTVMHCNVLEGFYSCTKCWDSTLLVQW